MFLCICFGALSLALFCTAYVQTPSADVNLNATAWTSFGAVFGIFLCLSFFRYLTGAQRKQRLKHGQALWLYIEQTHPYLCRLRTAYRIYLTLLTGLIVCISAASVAKSLGQVGVFPLSSREASVNKIAPKMAGNLKWRIYSLDTIFKSNLTWADEDRMIEEAALAYGEKSIPYSDLCTSLSLKHIREASKYEGQHPRFDLEQTRATEILRKYGCTTQNFSSHEYSIFWLANRSALESAAGRSSIGKDYLNFALASLNQAKDNPQFQNQSLEEIYWITALAAEMQDDHQLAKRLEQEWLRQQEISATPSSEANLAETPAQPAIDLSVFIALAALMSAMNSPFLLWCNWQWTKGLSRSQNKEQVLEFLSRLTTLALYDNRMEEANTLSCRMLAEVQCANASDGQAKLSQNSESCKTMETKFTINDSKKIEFAASLNGQESPNFVADAAIEKAEKLIEESQKSSTIHTGLAHRFVKSRER